MKTKPIEETKKQMECQRGSCTEKPEERFPSKSGMVLYFLRGSLHYFVLCVIFSMCVSLLDMTSPKIIGYMVDTVIGGKESDLPAAVNALVNRIPDGTVYLHAHPGIVALIVALIAVLAAVCRYFTNLFDSMGSEGLVQRMRNQLFDHILHLPFSWYNENHTGDIIQRCTSDVDTVRRFVSEQLTQLFRIAILITFALLFMAGINTQMMLAAFVFIPVIVLYSLFFHNRIADAFEHADVEEGKLSAIAQENLTGVRVVRAFGRESYERERFEKKNREYTKMWVRLMKLLSAFWGSGDLISGLQILVVTILGAVFCVQDKLTAGEYIAFVTYNSMLTWPVRGLGRVISEMSKAGISIERIRYIMNSPVERYAFYAEDGKAAPAVSAVTAMSDAGARIGTDSGNDAAGQAAFRFSGDIDFDHVSFRYQNPQNPDAPEVLRDVTFTVRGGTTIGILGGTGSGKSTLMYLLDRLYELPEGCGKITIGGQNIADLPLETLRSGIGMVLQEPYLFSRTLGENIAIAKDSATKDDIREASRIANLDEAVEHFAEQYETAVGERGVTLSGGQKQRAAIAQMLIRRPPIMIFDDSLSAVDAETDAKIRHALADKIGGSTVILIAHRITTLMQADEVVVLDRGQVAEIGTPDELYEKGGIYRRIYDLQLAGASA